MLHEEFDEIYGGDGLFDIDVILMAVVVESDGISRFIISVDPFCSDDRAAKIAADIFGNGLGIRQSRFGINVEAFVMNFVHFCFHLFEGRTDL